MVELEGRSFKRVDVPESGDVIFFGQRKKFEDVSLSWESVNNAINSGNLIVVGGNANFTPKMEPSAPKDESAAKEILKLREVIATKDKQALEFRKSVESNVSMPKDTSSAVVEEVAKLVGVLGGKIDSLVESGGTRIYAQAGSVPIMDMADPVTRENVFIPSLTVTDMKNNLNLKATPIKGSGSVNKAAEALKKMKQGN